MPQILSHHLLRRHPHYTEMNELYISLSLRALGLGLAGLFVPIYLYELGYSLMMIGVFFLISSLLRVVSEPLAAVSISKFGPKHVMVASYLFLMIYFLVLYSVPYQGALFYLAAILLAFEMSTFWSSHHAHLIFNRNPKKASTQVGTTLIARHLFMALGPIIGGTVAAIFGLQYVLLVSVFVLALAMYPLLQTRDNNRDFNFRLAEFKPMLPWRQDGIAQVAHQFDLWVSIYLWPLYMFLILGAFDEIGLILSVSIIGGVLLTYYVGRLGDRGLNRALLKAGSLIKAATHLLRLWSQSFFSLLGVNLLNDLGQTFLSGPFIESLYERADKTKNPFNYVVASNLLSALAKSLLWLLVVTLSFFISTGSVFLAVFLLAAPISLLVPLIAKPVK